MARRDRERQRERERRNRKRRKYGQPQLKHSKRGVWSCVLNAVVLIIVAALFIKAYVSEGTAAPIIGGFGFVAFVLSSCGLYMGLRGFKEREKDYLTCKIGASCSAFFILVFIIIFCRGLF
jgi:predicted phage tail protein